ncbi:hypothetical protein GOBAR_AA15029 [Gossypium barbadense]|uniref:Uncharacterized protein n=1 Tax=Gossypium barbadense TaxID=3634 RepID=A0A2P5XQQ4_GOSBA|nr:hypothetical protein GOBAR_AA15029 [Gossypium barbadense]
MSDIQPTPVFLGLVGAYGRVARSCLASFASPTPIFTHGHVTRPWRLIASHVGKKFYPVFPRSYCTALTTPMVWREEFTLLIPAINFINIRFKMSIVYLKGVEFGMNYLDCIIWENTEYRNMVVSLSI